MKIIHINIVLVIILFLPINANAQGECGDSVCKIYVDSAASLPGDGTSNNPYNDISTAIESALPKPLVLIIARPGTYLEPELILRENQYLITESAQTNFNTYIILKAAKGITMNNHTALSGFVLSNEMASGTLLRANGVKDIRISVFDYDPGIDLDLDKHIFEIKEIKFCGKTYNDPLLFDYYFDTGDHVEKTFLEGNKRLELKLKRKSDRMLEYGMEIKLHWKAEDEDNFVAAVDYSFKIKSGPPYILAAGYLDSFYNTLYGGKFSMAALIARTDSRVPIVELRHSGQTTGLVFEKCPNVSSPFYIPHYSYGTDPQGDYIEIACDLYQLQDAPIDHEIILPGGMFGTPPFLQIKSYYPNGPEAPLWPFFSIADEYAPYSAPSPGQVASGNVDLWIELYQQTIIGDDFQGPPYTDPNIPFIWLAGWSATSIHPTEGGRVILTAIPYLDPDCGVTVDEIKLYAPNAAKDSNIGELTLYDDGNASSVSGDGFARDNIFTKVFQIAPSSYPVMDDILAEMSAYISSTGQYSPRWPYIPLVPDVYLGGDCP